MHGSPKGMRYILWVLYIVLKCHVCSILHFDCDLLRFIAERKKLILNINPLIYNLALGYNLIHGHPIRAYFVILASTGLRAPIQA